MTKDEALRLALEALESTSSCIDGYYSDAWLEIDQAITAIKAALEAKDKPVTENGMYRLGYHNGYGFGEAYGKANAPQRTWVGLTYEEETELIRLAHNHAGIRFYIQAAEAKLKEKNT